MTLIKGQKMLHIELLPASMHLTSNGGEDYWLLGCLLLLASSFFWACWMILQVNKNKLLLSYIIFSFITFLSHHSSFSIKIRVFFGWFFCPSVEIGLTQLQHNRYQLLHAVLTICYQPFGFLSEYALQQYNQPYLHCSLIRIFKHGLYIHLYNFHVLYMQ